MASDKPQYAYTLDATVGMLLTQFLATENTSVKDLAALLEVTPQLVEQWLAGNVTNGLLTKLRANFETVTGIELDRLQVIMAKRDLAQEHPDLDVPMDRYQTRAEIIDAIRVFSDTTNAQLVAAQVPGISGQNLNHWLSGTHSCGGDNIKQLLFGLIRGFIPGDATQVLFVLTKRAVLKDLKLDDDRPDLTSYVDAVKMVLADQGDKTHTDFAKASGIGAHHLLRFRQNKPEEVASTKETMELVLRYLYKAKRPEKAKPAKQPDPPSLPPVNGKTHEVVPRALKPASPPPPSGDWRNEAGGLLEQLGRLVRRPDFGTMPQAAVPSTTDFSSVVAGDVPVGEDLEGVRFCLTAATFKQWPGRQLSRAELDDTSALITELRRRLVVIAGLDAPLRRMIYTKLGPEFDELYHAAQTAKVAGSAALELLDKEREAFTSIRAGLIQHAPSGATKKG